MGAAAFALCAVCGVGRGEVGGSAGFYGRGVTFHLLLSIGLICHAGPFALHSEVQGMTARGGCLIRVFKNSKHKGAHKQT